METLTIIFVIVAEIYGQEYKTMGLVIYPYKMGSQSAKELAKGLNCKRVFRDKAYHNKGNDLIINWGASQTPSWPFKRILNDPDCVATASNKLGAFIFMGKEMVNVPKFTDSMEDAKELLKKYNRVYCRKSLTGHSGHGIIIAEEEKDLVDAPLYVAGITGLRNEYRIHVFNGKVIDFQQKKKKVGADVNNLVRNHDSGWIYARNEVLLSTEAGQVSVDAVSSLGLDFGAVDIIIRREEPLKPYVLEVNTAPGLQNSTLTKYIEAVNHYDEGRLGEFERGN